MRERNGRHTMNEKYRQRYQQPINNPEIPSEKDWWQEICDAAGEKNYWKKDKKKARVTKK
jgi:hypothetical protein